MPRRMWTWPEICTVMERYPTEGSAQLAIELGRSEFSISGLARRFGQRKPRTPYHKSNRRRTTSP